MVLCFFLGGLGIHRFYMGKIVTGVLMLVTLGGLGIWSIIDMIIFIFSNFNDGKGRPLVDKNKSLVTVFAIIYILFIVVFFLGIIAAIAIPQYARYRQGSQDNAAQSAYHAVALAQEAYFANAGRYTNSYKDLTEQAGLIIDRNIEYSNIRTYRASNQPCFQLQVNHIASGSTVYDYDSCRVETVISSRR
jgi:Tfp pilus assembly protein PilE